MDRKQPMTDRADALLFIEDLQPVIKEYYATRNINHFRDHDQQVKFKKIWEQVIMPGSVMNIGCADCMKFGLDIMDSWFQRESKKEADLQEKEEKTTAAQDFSPVLEKEAIPVNKGGRPARKR